MKSIFFSLLVLGVVISITGCEPEGNTSVADGIQMSDVEKYNQMVLESQGSMGEGDEAMKKGAGN